MCINVYYALAIFSIRKKNDAVATGKRTASSTAEKREKQHSKQIKIKTFQKQQQPTTIWVDTDLENCTIGNIVMAQEIKVRSIDRRTCNYFFFIFVCARWSGWLLLQRTSFSSPVILLPRALSTFVCFVSLFRLWFLICVCDLQQVLYTHHKPVMNSARTLTHTLQWMWSGENEVNNMWLLIIDYLVNFWRAAQ